jgi:hypothetical protein
MSTLLRHLFLNNPMSLEATRVGRRFLRTGGDTGRALNYTVLTILGLLYVWLLFAVLRYREDMSEMMLQMELGILTLAVPASVYAAVSGEREKLTWDALIMTRLSPGQIIAGKLLWRVLMILGVMALFVPPLLLCHYSGGAWSDGGTRRPDYHAGAVMQAQAVIFGWSLMLCGFSLWVSAKTKRAITTLSLITVALLAFLALVPMLVSLFGGRVGYLSDGASPLEMFGSLLVHLNPFYEINALRTWGIEHAWGDMDAWRNLGVSSALPALYGGAALLLLTGAWRTLRGLEVPTAGRAPKGEQRP